MGPFKRKDSIKGTLLEIYFSSTAGCELVLKPTLAIESVTDLNLSGCPNITNAALVHGFNHMPNISVVSLCGCAKLDDPTVYELVKRCPKLERLDLSYTNITGDALKAIGKFSSKLEFLNTGFCKKIKGDHLRYLCSCHQLKTLNLSGWSPSPDLDAFALLEKQKYVMPVAQQMVVVRKSSRRIGNFSSIKKLEIRFWTTFTDTSFSIMLRLCPNLTSLDLTGCTQLTDHSLEILASPQIHHLFLRECVKITDKGIERISSGCPLISTLSLMLCPLLTETAFFAIGNGLTQLSRFECQRLDGITNQSVQFIVYKCINLTFFDIRGCKSITEEFLDTCLRHQSNKLQILVEESKQQHINDLF